MTPRRNNAPAPADAFHILAIGLFTGLALAAWFRIYNTMFPINVFGLGVLMYALLGFPAGAALVGRVRVGGGLVIAVAVGMAVFAACSVVNQNFTTHYLLGKAYYPYPLPENAALRIGALALTMLGSPLPFLASGRLFSGRFRTASNPWRACAWLVAGVLAGGVAGFELTLRFGPYLWLLLGVAGLTMMLPAGWWRAACAVLIAAAMVFSVTKKEEAFYVWRVGGYERLSTHWTPFYRVDFISFNNDRCIGAVYNTVMVWYVCPQVDMLPAEIRMIMKAVAKDKERVLIAGRTDGMYAQIIHHHYPKVKEVVSVECDPVVVRKMVGDYARYNNYVFRRPGFSAHAADVRGFLENEKEQYDLLFLNGIGIGLFYMPGSITRQEAYLTTKESYDVIFNRLLKDDGVFVIDWGSSREVEAIPMLANAPPGVHTRAYWFTMGQYPLVGLPLFFVFGSRSEAELDRISREIETMPTFQRIEPDPEAVRRGRFEDDRPLHNYMLAALVLVMTSPLAAGVLGVLVAMMLFSRRVRADFPGVAFFSTAGLAVGMMAEMVMTRNLRFFIDGAGTGVVKVAAALAAGLAAGQFLWVASKGKHSGFGAILAGLVLGAVFVWNVASGDTVAAMSGAFLVGCLGSALWGFGWSFTPPEKRPAALCASWLGGILGIYLCQLLIFTFGFTPASYVMAVVAALTGLYCFTHMQRVKAAE